MLGFRNFRVLLMVRVRGLEDCGVDMLKGSTVGYVLVVG